ncbi:hypothetical protein OHB26_23600 [Nocardia sp. NBC_01503]|uniref:hypothetical protein n=1 Tax=Nocardia sp. NBC_01503 TaxID=2975997 RepID=UPI002E7B1F4C|nr:hypothetical protein [Nocardia sp. NBC_01503]WTL29944.1 hypothetical protein OHB26_23600 [Nocardia sp. NBC_01503]
MAPEPIDQQNPSPEQKETKGDGDKPTLWMDPKNLPTTVNEIFKAAFHLSDWMDPADNLLPADFGDIVFQLRNYHTEMDRLRKSAEKDCSALAYSLTDKLNTYHITDTDGGAAVSSAPPPNASMPIPTVQPPVTVMPTQ